MYPKAWFSCAFPANQSAPVPGGPPYTVECIDLSYTEPGQLIGTWSWEFGDGGTSTLQRPVHSYTEKGEYQVRLTVTTLCGRQYTGTNTSSVSVFCSVPQAGFTTNVTAGTAPLAVQVTDTSTGTPAGITTWTYWLDNRVASNERNPVFTLSAPGSYTLSQTVWKDCVQAGSSPNFPYAQVIVVSPPAAAIPVNVTAGTSPAAPTPAPTFTSAPTPELTAAPVPALPVMTEIVPVRPETGTLSVATEPAGARVYVDDMLQGTSPVVISLKEGSHTLRLEKEGYNQTAPVLITAGETTDFSTTLAAPEGGIAILPVIALVVIIILVISGGIIMYLRMRADED
jgi:hypothetical protein